jgi:hypothetical protein
MYEVQVGAFSFVVPIVEYATLDIKNMAGTNKSNSSAISSTT